jgi:hypothetical protein
VADTVAAVDAANTAVANRHHLKNLQPKTGRSACRTPGFSFVSRSARQVRAKRRMIGA